MEKKGKIWTGLLAAALILIGVVAFAGFHQAAKWQESVRKEIQRLNWAVPMGHYDSLGGWVAFKDGEPYFPYAVKEADENRQKMIDTKGKTYNYDALTFDVDDEDEVDYETQICKSAVTAKACATAKRLPMAIWTTCPFI